MTSYRLNVAFKGKVFYVGNDKNICVKLKAKLSVTSVKSQRWVCEKPSDGNLPVLSLKTWKHSEMNSVGLHHSLKSNFLDKL